MSKEKFNNAVSIAKYICEKTLKFGGYSCRLHPRKWK